MSHVKSFLQCVEIADSEKKYKDAYVAYRDRTANLAAEKANLISQHAAEEQRVGKLNATLQIDTLILDDGVNKFQLISSSDINIFSRSIILSYCTRVVKKSSKGLR